MSHVLVVDLDGTLVRTNSFRTWTMRHFVGAAAMQVGTRRYVKRAAAFILLYGLRAMRIISHRRLKSLFLRVWAQTGGSSAEATEYAEWLRVRYLNERVHEFVRAALTAGEPVVLATAAPELYASPFAARLGMTVIATKPPDGNALCDETIGIRKAVKLREWLANQPGEHTLTVITDHSDDEPMLALAHHCVIVGPNPRLRSLAGNRLRQVLD